MHSNKLLLLRKMVNLQILSVHLQITVSFKGNFCYQNVMPITSRNRNKNIRDNPCLHFNNAHAIQNSKTELVMVNGSYYYNELNHLKYFTPFFNV